MFHVIQVTLVMSSLFGAAGHVIAAEPGLNAGNSASSSLLAFSSDGTMLACSNRDNGSVTILSWPELRKVEEIPVGLHPEGLTWIPETHLIACCVYGEDRIAVIDADSRKVVQQIDVEDEPYGIVSTADGQTLFATLEYPGKLIRISTRDWKVQSESAAGAMPRGIALSANQKSLFVTEYLTGKLLEIAAADGKLLRTIDAASTDNIARQVTLSADGRKAYVPHIRSRVSAAHGNGSIFPYVSVVTLDGEKSGQRVRVPMDSLRGAQVTANPWETALSPDGRRLFVIFGATDDMYVCRVLGDDYRELEYEAGVRLGSNPRAVRVAPEGDQVVVYNALDFEVVSMKIPGGSIITRCKVCESPMSEQMLLGKKLFYTALQPMSSRNWIACSSCHIDGDADGRTWQNPEGLRNTQSLIGLSWTHPVHWSADRDEVQDFEHTVRGLLMQGQGLLSGRLPEALEQPISGRSEMLDALAMYTNSHSSQPSPHSKGGLSEQAKRGRDLFLSDRTGCARCHSGPWYSDSLPRKTDEIVRHDVGTGNADPSELMGPTYDTPTLIGVYRTAPYLHHGKAATLRDVLTTFNPDDKHGKTSDLTESEISDLVEFLKALPYEDPEAQSVASGLKQVLK
ncbi:MAG: hypothetical protein ACK526_16060 [Planctomyces sp.]